MDHQESHPKALIYRGPATCDGCPESIASRLESSTSHFEVKFAGPNEEVDITAESLKDVQLYVQPGGGDLDPAWKKTKQYKKIIRDYVSQGGRYAGFCLGAYLAGGNPGFDILPFGSNATDEIDQPGTEVSDERDTVIRVDWDFQTGPRKGETDKGRWVYFQDGAVIQLGQEELPDQLVLGRYSSNGDIAASVIPFGKGWVGVVGPHPEADETWYEGLNFTNPDGIRFDIVHDFIETIMAQ